MTFLGTGGGRHTTMYQTRCTGGIIIEHNNGKFLHLDPGPGALTQMRRIHYDPMMTSSVIVSHAHPDHYSDAEVVIEGITNGGWKKRGHLYGSPTVINGENGIGPCISKYHLGMIENMTILKPDTRINVDGLKAQVTRTLHSDPTTVGFRFDSGFGLISYVCDTSFTEEIAKQHIGSRVLILPVTTPDNIRIDYHLCTEDAIKFIDIVKPELAIFIHLGIVMIKADPNKQAKAAEKATGIKTIAAKDLDELEVGTELTISHSKTYDDLWIPNSSPGIPY